MAMELCTRAQRAGSPVWKSTGDPLPFLDRELSNPVYPLPVAMPRPTSSPRGPSGCGTTLTLPGTGRFTQQEVGLTLGLSALADLNLGPTAVDEVGA